MTTLWSNLRIANAPEGPPGRQAYLASRVDRKAAFALFPRLVWTGFASYLALGIARLGADPPFD